MPCTVSLKLQREILLHRFLQTLPPYKATVPSLPLSSSPPLTTTPTQKGTKLDQTRSMFHAARFLEIQTRTIQNDFFFQILHPLRAY